MSKLLIKAGAVSMLGLFSTGCVVYEQRRPVATETVVVEPGVEIVEVEPAPEQRVYVYDEGYPPGVYFYDGYYWYSGRRYEHDVFVREVVVVNVRENRYVNVEENRRAGRQIEVQHRQAYAVNHGRTGGGANGPEVAGTPTRSAAAAPQRTAAHPSNARPEIEKRPRVGAQASAKE